jgi:hypothetical protein
MKIATYSLLLAGLIAGATASAQTTAPSQLTETSRLFFEQTGHTLAADTVSIDLEYSFISSAVATGLRAGALGGEVMLNSASDSISGFDYTSIGYKRSLQKGLSAYGILSYFDDELSNISATDFALGAAYTIKLNELSFNINPEVVTDDVGIRGGKNTIFVKASAALALRNTRTALVAEVILENNTFLDTVINLGARWQPRNNISVDLVVYSDGGDQGTTKGVPGYIIVNLLF